jgi:hypothetical protein
MPTLNTPTVPTLPASATIIINQQHQQQLSYIYTTQLPTTINNDKQPLTYHNTNGIQLSSIYTNYDNHQHLPTKATIITSTYQHQHPHQLIHPGLPPHIYLNQP